MLRAGEWLAAEALAAEGFEGVEDLTVGVSATSDAVGASRGTCAGSCAELLLAPEILDADPGCGGRPSLRSASMSSCSDMTRALCAMPSRWSWGPVVASLKTMHIVREEVEEVW